MQPCAGMNTYLLLSVSLEPLTWCFCPRWVAQRGFPFANIIRTCSTRTAALLRHPPCGSDSHPPRGSDTPWPPALRLWPACATTGRARTRTRPAALRLTSSVCPCSRWQAVCRAAHTLRDGQHPTGLRRVGSRCALRRAPACTTPRVGRAAPPRTRASPLRRLTPAIRAAALRECPLARSPAGGRKRECFPVRCSSAAHCALHSQHDIFHAQLRPKETRSCHTREGLRVRAWSQSQSAGGSSSWRLPPSPLRRCWSLGAAHRRECYERPHFARALYACTRAKDPIRQTMTQKSQPGAPAA